MNGGKVAGACLLAAVLKDDVFFIFDFFHISDYTLSDIVAWLLRVPSGVPRMGGSIDRQSGVNADVEARPSFGLIKAVAGECRYRILQCLREREKNVSQLVTELCLRQSTVSHGLRRLCDEGLVVRRSDGPYRFFSINEKVALPILEMMDGASNDRALRAANTKIRELEERIRELGTR